MDIYVNDSVDIIVNTINKKAIIYELNKRKKHVINWPLFLYIFLLDSKEITASKVNMSIDKHKKFQDCILELYNNKVLTLKKGNRFSEVVRFEEYDIPLRNIQLELTSKCNLQCKHCYLEGNLGQRELSCSDIYRIIDDAKDIGVHKIFITGGEPLIKNEIKDILRYIYDSNLRCELYTNAYLIDENFCRFLEEVKLDKIRISLDGDTEEVHDTFRGKSGSYNKVLEAINMLKQLNIPISINTVLHKNNIDRIENMRNLFENNLKVPYKFDYILEYGNAANNFEEIGISIEEYCSKVSIEVMSIINMYKKGYKKSSSFCNIGKDFVYITSNGIVKPCPSIPDNINYGDLEVDSLKDIWKRTSDKFYNLACKEVENCRYSKLCGSGCRSRGLSYGGTLDFPDLVICELFKKYTQIKS